MSPAVVVVLLSLVGALMAPFPLLGQSPPARPEVRVAAAPWRPPPPLFAGKSDLVATDIVVRDQDDRPISGLTMSDFRVVDKGRPQTISAFSVIHSAEGPADTARQGTSSAVVTSPSASSPRFIALLFDDVSTSVADLGNARNAAMRFVREQLHPGDEIAIFTSSSSQSLAFTRDPVLLARVIGQIRTHPRSSSLSS